MTRLDLILIVLLFCFYGVSCNTDPKANEPISNIKEKPIADSVTYQQGKLIFIKYCNTCHIAPEINRLDQYLFDNLFERLPAPPEEYFIKYIQDSKFLKASGDKYALRIDEIYNSEFEHNFEDSLSQPNFSDLIFYIKEGARLRYE